MGAAVEAFGMSLNGARRVRFWNAVTAAFCGVLPALVLIRAYPARWRLLLAGFLIGLVWSNGFEYAYHRWILHWPKGTLGKGHLLHHSTLGTPYDPEHVTFGSSPLAVAMIFVVNGIPVILLDRAFNLRIAAGMLIGFAVYFIITEEVHWRMVAPGPFGGTSLSLATPRYTGCALQRLFANIRSAVRQLGRGGLH